MAKGKTRKRRSARRKLNAHDRGENRHNKGLAWMLKRDRAAAEFHRAKQQSRLDQLETDRACSDRHPAGEGTSC